MIWEDGGLLSILSSQERCLLQLVCGQFRLHGICCRLDSFSYPRDLHFGLVPRSSSLLEKTVHSWKRLETRQTFAQKSCKLFDLTHQKGLRLKLPSFSLKVLKSIFYYTKRSTLWPRLRVHTPNVILPSCMRTSMSAVTRLTTWTCQACGHTTKSSSLLTRILRTLAAPTCAMADGTIAFTCTHLKVELPHWSMKFHSFSFFI